MTVDIFDILFIYFRDEVQGEGSFGLVHLQRPWTHPWTHPASSLSLSSAHACRSFSFSTLYP